MPYRVLTAIFAVAAMLSLPVRGRPRHRRPHPRPRPRRPAILLAEPPRSCGSSGDGCRHGLTLDLASWLLGIVIACIGAATVPTASGQVLIGTGFVLFGVYIAYFRPQRVASASSSSCSSATSRHVLVNRQLTHHRSTPLHRLPRGGQRDDHGGSVGNALRALALRDSLTGRPQPARPRPGGRTVGCCGGPQRAGDHRRAHRHRLVQGLQRRARPHRRRRRSRGARRRVARGAARLRHPRALRRRRVRARAPRHATRGRRRARGAPRRRQRAAAGPSASSSGRRRRISTPRSAAPTP